MHIIVSGLSHKTAPVEIREALTFEPHQLSDALTNLLSYPYIYEGVIVSTCNRTEVYAVTSDVENAQQNLVDFLESRHNLNRNLPEYLYFYDSLNAVHHLFRVAASLDSMVVGEAQVLGQVKEAYSYAFEAQATNIILNRLFRTAFSVGKRVRTETDIGESAVSISYAAVQLAKKVFEDLAGRTVMILGAGKMSELTAKHLLSNGVTNVLIANRSPQRAVKMAKTFKGRAVPFDQHLEEMVKADIVISSTGAPHYILSKEEMFKVMAGRRYRPIFLIDIAVPRDIDPAVNEINNAYLYDIDDLQSVVDSNLAQRSREAKEAEKIIKAEVEEFLAWMSSLEVVPTISELKEKAEKIRQMEIEKALDRLKRLKNLSAEEENIINALTSGIINKLLHQPMVRMKESARSKEGYLYVESLRHLFALDEEKKTEEGQDPSEVKDRKHQLGASQ